MKAFLVAGGSIEKEFLKKSYKEENYDLVIGIDGGAAYLLECDIAADIILGDFDTLDKEILDYYKSTIRAYNLSSYKACIITSK